MSKALAVMFLSMAHAGTLFGDDAFVELSFSTATSKEIKYSVFPNGDYIVMRDGVAMKKLSINLGVDKATKISGEIINCLPRIAGLGIGKDDNTTFSLSVRTGQTTISLSRTGSRLAICELLTDLEAFSAMMTDISDGLPKSTRLIVPREVETEADIEQQDVFPLLP